MGKKKKKCGKLATTFFCCTLILGFYYSRRRGLPSKRTRDNKSLNYDVLSNKDFDEDHSWDKFGKKNLVEQAKPWMSKQVQALICSYLNSSDSLMLEYGGGGSTLFFSQYVKYLYTVESVEEFYHRLQKNLVDQGIQNVQVILKPPNGFFKDAPASLEKHEHISEMRRCDLVNKNSLEFWLNNGGPQGIKLPAPTKEVLQQNYHKFKGNYKHNSAYIYGPLDFGINRFDAVLIDGVARGACAFWILNYIDENSRVFIHDFFHADSSQNWEDKFNLNGLRKYYHVVAKIEELSPYVSGGTVVVLQKKTDAEVRRDFSHMNKFQKARILHRDKKEYKDFF
jgi:hypothetical protein